MAFPKNINVDQVVREVMNDLRDAVDGWSKGRPKDETALLNRITEKLSRNRRKCDVGVDTPVGMEAKFYELHRKGKNQTDLYGTDLGVTISVPSEQFLKTVFFQLKISKAYRAPLEAKQLDQCLNEPLMKNRGYVLTVDEERFGSRVSAVLKCRKQIKGGKASTIYDVSKWNFLSEWLVKWFKCSEGPRTMPNDKNPIEPLLEKFRLPSDGGIAGDFESENFKGDLVPAKHWMRYTFKPKESNEV